MKYKVNILEPWESGTVSAVDALIVKETGDQFLLFIENNIKVGGENAHYFICKFKNQDDALDLKTCVKKIYPIHMVYDKHISDEQQELPDIGSYRANFLAGEIVISS